MKEAIAKHHYADMKNVLYRQEIKHEDFTKPQSYLHEKSVESGRLSFRIRSKMVDNIPANFKNKFKKNSEGLICKYCSSGEVLSQSHCLVCRAWH